MFEMGSEKREFTNNTESEVEIEREQFAENLGRLAGNLAELPDVDEITKPVPMGLKGRIEALRGYFRQTENILAFSVVAGNVGVGLLDTFASSHLARNYEILRNDPALQDALRALGVDAAVAAFRKQALKYGPKISRILREEYG